MDQNRPFYIILIVTIASVILLGVSIWLLTPPTGPSNVADDRDGIEFIRPASSYVADGSDLREPRSGQSDTSQEASNNDLLRRQAPSDSIDSTNLGYGASPDQEEDPLDGLREEAPQTATSTEQNRTGRDTEEADISGTIASSETSREASQVTVPARTETVAARSTQAITDSATDSTIAGQTREPQQVTEYWIQLISSPSRDRIEVSLESIQEYGISGKISNKDIEGTLYYRLRVGPYEVKPEADKFLEWVQKIDGFEGSYITLEYNYR